MTKPVSVVVSAADIRPFLVKELARLSASGESALAALGRQVAAVSGETLDGTTKRIRWVLRGWRPLLRAHDADCLLLACNPPRFLEKEAVPHFPGSRQASCQMILDHQAATGQRLTKDERDRLAHQLYKFSQGFLNAVQEDAGVMAEAA